MGRQLKLLKKETVFTDFFSVNRFKISFKTDTEEALELSRICMERGDSVALFAYDPERDLILLIEEFRIGAFARAIREGYSDEEIEEYSFNLGSIAGMLDKGLTPEETICVEAEEEAGVELSNVEKCYEQPIIFSSGGSSEACHYFYAEIDSSTIDLEVENGAEGEGERIKSFLLSPDELKEKIKNKEINDTKTILAFQWFLLNKDRCVE